MLGGDEIAARYGISQPLLINVVHTDFPLTGNSFQYTPKAILKCNGTFINIKKKQYNEDSSTFRVGFDIFAIIKAIF